MSGNDYAVARTSTWALEEDYAYLEKMPKNLRIALIEARFSYGAKPVFEAYQDRLNAHGSPQLAEQEVRHMLYLNDQELVAAGKQFYVDLTEELRREKQERIEKVFQRAS